MSDYLGIDYGRGQTNINKETGIRYGVISQHDITQAWCDSSDADYGSPELDAYDCPECGHNCCDDPNDMNWGDSVSCEECGESFDVELPDFCEPLGFYVDDGEYKLTSCLDSDVMVLHSPYFTHGQYCSPCVPGAVNLNSPCENGAKAYCLGHDWFDDNVAPYPVYSVATGELVPAKTS